MKQRHLKKKARTIDGRKPHDTFIGYMRRAEVLEAKQEYSKAGAMYNIAAEQALSFVLRKQLLTKASNCLNMIK